MRSHLEVLNRRRIHLSDTNYLGERICTCCCCCCCCCVL